MNDGLRDPFQHNNWATQQLLTFCRDLSDEQLDATTPGVYGSVLATLQHMIAAEAGYQRHLTGARPEWPQDPTETRDLAVLDGFNQDLARGWEAMLDKPIDSERLIELRGEAPKRYEAHVGVVIAQVFNHGNEHRGQICTVLTTLGFEPPDIDGWTYSLASGRAKTLS